MKALVPRSLTVLTISLLSTLMVPLKASSEIGGSVYKGQPMFHPFVPHVLPAKLGIGEGGLVAYFDSNITIKPSDLSYRYLDGAGELLVNLKGEEIAIELSPDMVSHIVRLVQPGHLPNNPLELRVSHNDLTAVGRRNYVDKEIQYNGIGDIFLEADIDFAEFVWGNRALPSGSPVHPDIKKAELFKTDSEFRNLTQDWATPPQTRPNISLHFDPEISGLVRLELDPQVEFRSTANIPLEMGSTVKEIAERPYIEMQEDVKERPLAYRNASHMLDEASEIVAVMGILEAACIEKNSCRALLHQTDKIAQERATSSQSQASQWSAEEQLSEQWQEETYLTNYQLGDTPESWRVAYEGVWQVVKGNIGFTQEEKIQDLAQRQFLEYEIPDSPLLKAASAVVLSWMEEKKSPEEAITYVIDFQETVAPLERVEALALSEYAIRRYEDALYHIEQENIVEIDYESEQYIYAPEFDLKAFEQEQINLQSLSDKVNGYKNEALKESFNSVETYLEGCLEKPGSCSSEDLRIWESRAYSAGLTEDGTWGLNLDVAWIHGLFNYLVGVQHEDVSLQLDRLRYLSYYVDAGQGAHSRKLQELESEWTSRVDELLRNRSNVKSMALGQRSLAIASELAAASIGAAATIALGATLFSRNKGQAGERDKKTEADSMILSNQQLALCSNCDEGFELSNTPVIWMLLKGINSMAGIIFLRQIPAPTVESMS